jgi:plastocyanin domain-containing protein
LKEGDRRLDFELTMLSKPEGPIVKVVVQAFTLSFDLWKNDSPCPEQVASLDFGIHASDAENCVSRT